MTDDQSVKRRIRAAMVLADLTIPELAKRIETPGLGARTVRKLQDENNTERAPRRHELRLIAEACDVPAWFLERGFADASEQEHAEDAELSQRLAELERTLGERLDAVEGDLSAVLELAAKWPTAEPPGVRGSAPPASPRTGSTPRPSERQGERGPQRGTEQ